MESSKPLTPEEIRALVERGHGRTPRFDHRAIARELAKGTGLSETARKFGCSVGTVQGALKKALNGKL